MAISQECENAIRGSIHSAGGAGEIIDALNSGVSGSNASYSGTLAVTGASTLTGNVACGGTLTVTGASTLTGNVGCSGTLTVTGAATLNSTLAANGNVTVAEAKNIVVGTTTGTKIGTATSQKLGFFNATPVIQQTGAGTLTTGFTAVNTSTVVAAASTFTGNVGTTTYTISEIVAALKNLGLIAA